MYLTALHTAHLKKAFFSLLCSIFYFHDMEEKEKMQLKEFAKVFEGERELKWACEFVRQDILTSFERTQTQVLVLLTGEDNNTKLDLLNRVWEVTKDKGYINQKEANLLLGIARNWSLEAEFIDLVKSN